MAERCPIRRIPKPNPGVGWGSRYLLERGWPGGRSRPSGEGPIRALSLDLHETIVWDTEEIVAGQYGVRYQNLARNFAHSDGRPVRSEEVGRIREDLVAEWAALGESAETVSLGRQVEQIRQGLGAQYLTSFEQALRDYSEGGLREHPVEVTQEAKDLVRSLNRKKFPVVVVSNTSRSGSAWKSFVETAGGFHLEAVFASTDIGARKPDARIFREAARSLGLTPSEVLHVGDRWKLDVEGALGAGMWAALYRGLWRRYWDPAERRGDAPAGEHSVPVLNDLREVQRILDGP